MFIMKVLGIDEAGKGPVLGDLVISGYLIDEKDEPKLKDLGVKDSKLISPSKREYLFEKVKKIAKGYEILEVSPKEIDEAVLSEEMNLNKLEAIKSAIIINKLKPDKAILDSPSVNTEAYKEYVKTFLKNKDVELVVENKADYKYLSVGAASILAKVTRDRGIEKLKKKYGNLGSGYPSDPTTKEFIKNNFEKCPEIFRKSWKTFQNLVKNKEQKGLGQF
jgi:ribonuclease HII